MMTWSIIPLMGGFVLTAIGVAYLFATLLRHKKLRTEEARPTPMRFSAANEIGNLKTLGDKELAAGDVEAALHYYRRAGEYEYGARVAQKAGLPGAAAELYERVGLLERAFDLYVEAGDQDHAAGCARRIGRVEDAARLYEAAGRVDDSIDCWLAAENPFEAAAVLVRNGRRREASILIAEEAYGHGDKEEAAKHYASCGEFLRAAHIYEEIDDLENAADMFEQAGAKEDAFRCRSDATSVDYRAKILAESGDTVGLARLYEETGQLVRSGDAYALSGLDAEAARVYELGKCWAKAAQMRKQLGELDAAVSLFQRAGNLSAAGECLEAAKRYDDAAVLYRKAGDDDGLIRVLRSSQNYYRLGCFLATKGQTDPAIEMLEAVPKDHPKYGKALMTLAKLLIVKKDYYTAELTLRDVLESADIDLERTRQARIHLAKLLELRGAFHDAFAQLTIVRATLTNDPTVERRYRRLAETVRKNKSGRQTTQTPIDQSLDDGPESIIQPVVLDLEDVMADLNRKPAPSHADRRYEVLDQIGEGSFGLVYKAIDKVLGRTVVMKFLRSSGIGDDSSRDRFFREARIAAGLNHRNIITVHDVGEFEGRPFIAMEFVEGYTLEDRLQDDAHPLSGDQVMSISTQLCSALSHAHAQHVVHRDIKPGNVMITRSFEVKLTDFGMAKVVQTSGGAASLIFGTPYYMAPEQIEGGAVDQRTDLYSFGVVLYRMVTGALPFPKGNVLVHHATSEPQHPTLVRPDVSDPIAQVILRCLRKNPDERYQTAEELARDLANAYRMEQIQRLSQHHASASYAN